MPGGSLFAAQDAQMRKAYARTKYDLPPVDALARIAHGKGKTAEWKAVYKHGLPLVLSVFPLTLWELQGRWRKEDLRRLSAYGVGGGLVRFLNGDQQEALRLREALERRGWRGQLKRGEEGLLPLLHTSTLSEDLQIALALEALLFDRHGWRLWRCGHGKHWYIADYHRKEDCPAHREAGQQARYREYDKSRRRNNAR